MGETVFIEAINEFNNKIKFLNTSSLVIILGESKNLHISKFLSKRKNIKLVSINPIFKDFEGQKSIKRFNKKIRESWIPIRAEEVKMRNLLLKYKNTDIESIVLMSFNAHTHSGKFLDRIYTSALKIFPDITIYAISCDCCNSGLYKRQINDILKYPITRRNDKNKHRGWLLNIKIHYN